MGVCSLACYYARLAYILVKILGSVYNVLYIHCILYNTCCITNHRAHSKIRPCGFALWSARCGFVLWLAAEVLNLYSILAFAYLPAYSRYTFILAERLDFCWLHACILLKCSVCYHSEVLFRLHTIQHTLLLSRMFGTLCKVYNVYYTYNILLTSKLVWYADSYQASYKPWYLHSC